jgi:threonine/homoserine/homoserine lactone efflux protein
VIDVSPVVFAAATGAALGLTGGIAPGPLTALVVQETLQHGTAAGARVALAPVLTDGPLLLVSAAFATALAGLDVALGVLGLVGAGFLLYLAWEGVSVRQVDIDPDASPGSLYKAIVVNLLNPHPYVFWVGVGGPLVAEAWAHSAGAALAFLVGFFGLLCGSKLALALLVGRVRRLLQGVAYLWTVRLMGVALAALAALLAWDAVGRLTS